MSSLQGLCGKTINTREGTFRKKPTRWLPMSFFLTSVCITCVIRPKGQELVLCGICKNNIFRDFIHSLSSPIGSVPRLSEPMTQSANASSQPLNELQWWMPFQWSSPHLPSWIERARCHLSHTSRPEANRDSHGLVIATPTNHLKLSCSLNAPSKQHLFKSGYIVYNIIYFTVLSATSVYAEPHFLIS